MLGVEYRNVGRGSALHEGIWLDTSPVFMESAWKMRVPNHVASASWRGYTRNRKGTVSTDKEIDMFEMKGERKTDFCPVYTSTRCSKCHWKMMWSAGKIQKAWGTIGRLWIWLPHKLACCWRRVPVLYFAGAAPKSDVRLQADYWECRNENPPGQDDHSEQLKGKQKKSKWRSTTLKLRYYLRARVGNILDEEFHFSNRKKQRSKIEPERPGHLSTDTNKSWHQDLTPYNTDSAFSTRWSRRCWATPLAFGHYQRNMKEWYDRLNAKCFASSSKQRENIQKENSAQQEWGRWRRQKANHRSSDEETAEGISSNTDCDQDSHISFMNDTDEDIDTSEIEEEDWVEYMKCSTQLWQLNGWKQP